MNTEFSCIWTEISVFSPNTGKYKPEKTPYLDTFHLISAYVCNINIKFVKNGLSSNYYVFFHFTHINIRKNNKHKTIDRAPINLLY